MRRRWRMKSVLAAVLAFVLLFGAVCAAAESWPEETAHDADGKTYKQVQEEDGSVQVWVLIGVFGSPDEALVSVGLQEDEKGGEGGETGVVEDKPEEGKPEESKPEEENTEGKKGAGKVEIVSKPYDYEMKKTSEKGAVSEGEKQTKSTGSETKTTIPLKYKSSKQSKAVIPLEVKSSEPKKEEDGGGVVEEEAKSEKSIRPKKKKSNKLVTVRNMPVMTVEDVWKGFSQVYIQDNRGSGR